MVRPAFDTADTQSASRPRRRFYSRPYVSVRPRTADAVCVASRYIGTDWCRLPYRSTVAPPESPESVHQRILVLSRDHLIWAFAEASCSIDVLQALCILFIFKEPEDAQAGFYFSRVSRDNSSSDGKAVLLAQELQLGRLYTPQQVETMSPDQRGAVRVKQRTW